MKRFLMVGWMVLLAASAQAAEPSVLNPSGLPVPRFVSLKSDEVNVRVGPGKRYPTKYVYKRQRLPVKIVEEFAHWRKIADYEGASGWVHKGMLDGRRTAMIIGKPQPLFESDEADAKVAFRAKPMVIGAVKQCKPDWCELDIQGHQGWIRKTEIWGVGREEVIGE